MSEVDGSASIIGARRCLPQLSNYFTSFEPDTTCRRRRTLLLSAILPVVSSSFLMSIILGVSLCTLLMVLVTRAFHWQRFCD